MEAWEAQSKSAENAGKAKEERKERIRRRIWWWGGSGGGEGEGGGMRSVLIPDPLHEYVPHLDEHMTNTSPSR